MRRRNLLKMMLLAFGGLSGSAHLKPTVAQAASVPGGGLPIPSLDDERNTYRSWGWTWPVSAEPNYQSDPTYSVSDPDIHGDTEGDDLWSYLMMYRRTGQQGYLDRASAWARYFKSDYGQCVGSSTQPYCYDSGFLYDHAYGWGLVAWYENTGDAAALTAAAGIASDIQSFYAARTPGSQAMAYWNLRAGGRHLHFITRLAEATGAAQWITLRDKLINLWMQSPDWDDTYKMYWHGVDQTASQFGSGAYEKGRRYVNVPFQIGVLAEGMWHAWRTTGRADVRQRIIDMAGFVDAFCIDKIGPSPSF